MYTCHVCKPIGLSDCPAAGDPEISINCVNTYMYSRNGRRSGHSGISQQHNKKQTSEENIHWNVDRIDKHTQDSCFAPALSFSQKLVSYITPALGQA